MFLKRKRLRRTQITLARKRRRPSRLREPQRFASKRRLTSELHSPTQFATDSETLPSRRLGGDDVSNRVATLRVGEADLRKNYISSIEDDARKGQSSAYAQVMRF